MRVSATYAAERAANDTLREERPRKLAVWPTLGNVVKKLEIVGELETVLAPVGARPGRASGKSVEL